MMVTTPGEVSLQPLFSILKDKTTSADTRIKTYQAITSYIKDGDSEKFESFINDLVPRLKTAFECINNDCKSDNPEIAQASLQTLGFCAFQEDITSRLSKVDTDLIINTLCEVVKETTDKNTCTRALWCLSKQTFSASVVEKQIEKIVTAVEHGQCKKKFQSMTVEHEAVNALIRLLDQVPKAMASQASKWGPLVYGPTVHAAAVVREKALVAMEKGFQHMLLCQDELAKRLAADLKAQVLISELNRLMKTGQECHVLSVWMYYVKLLGKALHSGSLINQMLPIVEQGFKNPSAKVKAQSYQAWETLIDNFSLNPDIIGDHKRVKLLMQVFRINNAKFESVAMAKLMAWWHFVIKLGEKISQYFDQVCVPLMHYCVNGTVTPTGLTPGGRTSKHPTLQRLGSKFGSPNTPNLNIANSNSPGLPQTFKSVQIRGQEVVAQFIGRCNKDVDNPKPKFIIEEVKTEVITGVHFFLKHHQTLIGAVVQGIISIGSDVSDDMLYYLWNSMMLHVRTVVEVTGKKDHTDLFSFFMSSFKELIDGQCLDQNKLLKLFVPVVNLPEKVLSSLAYQIGETSALTQGCPGLFLIEVLFNHRILETCSSHERFFCLMEKLISYGFSNSSACLSFCQTVMEQMGHKAGNIETNDTLWRMWSIVATSLTDTIRKTNEVNQGNNMDHDFTALCTTLTFPILHIIGDKLSQSNIKTLLKTWTELYVTFTRLAAMVTTIESNLVCEELCALILEGLKEAEDIDATYIECMIQICDVIAKQLNFTDTSTSSSSLMSSFGKKTDKSIGNLTSFINLLHKLLHCLNEKALKCSMSYQTYLVAVGILSMLFTHIPSPQKIGLVVDKLAVDSAELIRGNCTKTNGKTFTSQFNQKIEKLWLDISTALEGRYMGPYDSDLLASVSPLLEITFLHTRRSIKTQTMTFWSATFAKTPSLKYPEKLKSVLATVRTKSPIVLPGWDATSVGVLEEAPVSQMTQGESQVAVPDIMNISPRKEFGSFLNKVASPNVKKSPLRHQDDNLLISPNKSGSSSVKKKLSLKIGVDDMNSNDFVVISNTPKRNRVLTEHQREVMKEKQGNIPALYSSVDASMDASLMQQFCSSSSQMESQISSTPSIESMDITPFPFMKPAEPKQLKLSDNEQEKSSKRPSIDKNQKNSNSEQKHDNSEKQGSRRRRSVRFSDELNTSTESSSDDKRSSCSKDSKVKSPIEQKTVAKVGRKRKSDAVSDSDTSIDENMSGGSRASLRIKSRMTKQKMSDTDNDQDNTYQNKSIIECKNTCSQNVIGSIVFINETELLDSEKVQPEKTDDKISADLESTGKNSVLENDQSILCGQKNKHCDSEINNVSDSPRKISDPLFPDSDQYSILLSSENGIENYSSKVNEKTDISKSNSDSSVKSSPLKRAEIKSPKKFKSPKKPEGNTTLDKWFQKSKKSTSDANETQELGSSQSPQLNMLFSPKTGKVSEVGKHTPVVMVEDSQQYSPSKPEDTVTSVSNSKLEQQVSIEETPLKETGNNETRGNTEEAARSLHGMLALQSPEVVPDSEVFKVSQLVNKDTSPVGVDPIIKLHKLSADQIHLYSPAKSNNLESASNQTAEESNTELKPGRNSRQNLISVSKNNQKSVNISIEPHEVDDIIPSSQDSFSYSTTDSKISEVNKIKRPFAMFSGNDTIPNTEEETEPIECCDDKENTKEHSEVVTNMDQNNVKSSALDNCSEVLECSEEKVKSASTSQISSDFQEHNVESQIQSIPQESTSVLDSATLLVKKKVGRPRKSLSCETVLSTDVSVKNGNDSSCTTSQDSLVDKFRSRRKDGTPKRFNKESFRKTIKTPTKKEDGATSEMSQNDSENQTRKSKRKSLLNKNNTKEQQGSKVTESDHDSTSLFSNSEKVEIVEIKRKVKNNPAGKNNLKNKISCEVISDQRKNSVSELDEHNSKEHSGVSDSEDDLPLSQVAIKGIKEYTVKNIDGSSIANAGVQKTNTGKVVVEEQKTDTEDDVDEDDVPLTSLLMASDKSNVSGTSDKLDKGQLGGKKSTTKRRINKMLSIDMRTSPINKKLRSSKPALKVKLTGKGDRLKLRKKAVTPKRNKGTLSKKLQHESNNEEIVSASSDVVNDDKVLAEESSFKDPVKLSDKEISSKVVVGGENVCQIGDSIELSYDESGQLSEECTENTVNPEETVEECKDKEEGEPSPPVKSVEDCRDKLQASPVKMTDDLVVGKTSPLKPVSVRCSPPKKGKPFDMPETPTSSVAKTMGLTRADYIMQKSRLLLGRQVNTPSPMVRRTFKQARSCFSEPRKGIKRSSILKLSPKNNSPVKFDLSGSPPAAFKPVNLPKIYSPSASPSAGILKRRRISGDSPADSPSPPNKQRRVSFAESVETRLYERPKARLVGRSCSPRPVSRCLDMPKHTPSPLVTTEQQKKAADSQLTPSMDSVCSTQESQLNCKDPIYPELVSCEEPVDQVLMQLTSSVWSRGLGQLIRARNITTIGHLSALTEYDVNNLPIKSPKIETMKKALKDFADRFVNKSPIDIADALDSSIDSDPGVFETSTDLLDEIKQLDDEREVNKTNSNTDSKVSGGKDINESDKCTKDASSELIRKLESSKEKDYDNKLKRQSILNGIKSIKDLVSVNALMGLPAHSLIQIQTELNNMMSNVVVALQSKVPLSPSSESSQEQVL